MLNVLGAFHTRLITTVSPLCGMGMGAINTLVCTLVATIGTRATLKAESTHVCPYVRRLPVRSPVHTVRAPVFATLVPTHEGTFVQKSTTSWVLYEPNLGLQIIQDGQHPLRQAISHTQISRCCCFGLGILCTGRTGPHNVKVAWWVLLVVPSKYVSHYVLSDVFRIRKQVDGYHNCIGKLTLELRSHRSGS